RIAATHQRNAGTMRPIACEGLRRDSQLTTPASASIAPKLHTMAAPVGRSAAYDAASPAALASAPTAQPIASWRGNVAAKRTPTAAGMIRNENTRSTPARATELVTTTPKLA